LFSITFLVFFVGAGQELQRIPPLAGIGGSPGI
jgi:hypothetical protein